MASLAAVLLLKGIYEAEVSRDLSRHLQSAPPHRIIPTAPVNSSGCLEAFGVGSIVDAGRMIR